MFPLDKTNELCFVLGINKSRGEIESDEQYNIQGIRTELALVLLLLLDSGPPIA